MAYLETFTTKLSPEPILKIQLRMPHAENNKLLSLANFEKILRKHFVDSNEIVPRAYFENTVKNANFANTLRDSPG